MDHRTEHRIIARALPRRTVFEVLLDEYLSGLGARHPLQTIMAVMATVMFLVLMLISTSTAGTTQAMCYLGCTISAGVSLQVVLIDWFTRPSLRSAPAVEYGLDRTD